MESNSDRKLVKLAQGGDARALEHLFERHYLQVYRLSYKWCGVKESAEDVAQEVFVRLVRKLHTFTHRSSFKTWLYRIVVNAARDAGRRSAGRRAGEEAWVRDQRGHNPAPAGEEALTAARLHEAIGRLPAKQKEAVLLVCDEGLSHREAARVLNCRETTVSWRIFTARKKLNAFLDRVN